MDVLEKRVAERMQAEARTLRAEQMQLGRKRVSLAKEGEKSLAACAKALALLREGKSLTKAQASASVTGSKVAARVARELLALNARMDENSAALALLEDPAEAQRRVAHAKELGVGEKPLTGLDAAEIVILRHGRPRHVRDLTKEVLETGLVKLSGKTPEQTMSAYLAKDVKRSGTRFVKVGPGVFTVKDLAEAEKQAAAA